MTIITFASKTYAQAYSAGAPNPKPICIELLGAGELLSLYNLVAANLGQGRVKRFSDTASARKRTWAKLVEYQATIDAEAKADDFSMSPAELSAQTLRPKADEGQHDDLQEDAEMAGYEAKVTLTPADRAQIADEAAARKSVELPKSEQLIAAAAAAKAAPTTGGRSNIWRRPKHENPSKIAYRPEDGTVQAGLYALLTKPGGIEMDAYCAAAKQLKTKDSTLFTPPSVWGALRYLFVTSRGYGLDFDGTKLQLLVPADERQSSRKLKREG